MKYRIALCTASGEIIDLDKEVADKATCVDWLHDCERVQPNLWHVPQENGRTDIYAKLVLVGE